MAKILIDSYFESFPEFKGYMDTCVYEAKTKGYVFSLLGRKRRLPKLTYDTIKLKLTDKSQIQYFKPISTILNKTINNHKNISYNMPIQGTSGQTTLIAMTNIWKDPKSFSYTRNFDLKNIGELCKTCDYAQNYKGGCTTRSSCMTGIPHNDPCCFHRYEKEVLNLE